MSQVTIAQARFDMRCDDEVTDEQVQDLIDRATAIVLDYIKIPLIPDDMVLSGVVLSAIRLVAVGLFQDPSSDNQVLSPAIKSLLARSRDPAIA
jgi:hypothetical protein